MKTRLLLLISFLFVLISCSKENEISHEPETKVNGTSIINSISHFNTITADTKSLIVIFFTAQRNGACRLLHSAYDQLSTDYGPDLVNFYYVDVDELPELSVEYGVKSHPHFVFLKDGDKAVAKYAGTNIDSVEALIIKHISLF